MGPAPFSVPTEKKDYKLFFFTGPERAHFVQKPNGRLRSFVCSIQQRSQITIWGIAATTHAFTSTRVPASQPSACMRSRFLKMTWDEIFENSESRSSFSLLKIKDQAGSWWSRVVSAECQVLVRRYQGQGCGAAAL